MYAVMFYVILNKRKRLGHRDSRMSKYIHTVSFSKSATAEAHAHSLEIIAAHLSQRVPRGRVPNTQSILQPTRKAWMGLPHQQSVTQPVIARYVRLSGSPCRLSTRSCRRSTRSCWLSTCSCVGKRCIVNAITPCVANINQDNRRFLRLSSVGSLPLAKNALHCTSNWLSCNLIG